MSTPNEPLGEVLPTLYARLMPELMQTQVPVETGATCSHCAMIKPPDAPAGGSLTFRPDVKCCTYPADLPNFLVGGVLADETGEMAEGQRRLRERIRVGSRVEPMGIESSHAQSLLYSKARDVFGRAPDLKCGYYDDGACTVWRFRNAVCSTWYCKHTTGAEGQQFWMQVRGLVGDAESALAEYAVLDLGLEPPGKRDRDDTNIVEVEDLGNPSSALQRERWGQWRGREEEFYVACYRAVGELDADAFERIVGIRARSGSHRVRQALTTLYDESLPARLRRNPKLGVHRLPDGSAELTGYSSLDPIHAAPALAMAVDAFDGYSTTKHVLEQLEAEASVRLSPELIRKLVRFEVLIPVEEDELTGDPSA